jgi:membrane protein DedA with SNARE-associated domain
MLTEWVDTIVAFARENQQHLLPIVFVVAFLECLAFVSILAPATVIFTALGAVAGAGEIGLLPIAVTASLGSIVGYEVSYLIGALLEPKVVERWPLNRRPDLYEKTHRFFERWGALGIFVSHFWGQVRPLAPLVAGIVAMPKLPFHLANVAGSIGWSFGVFYASGTIGEWLW